MKLLYSYLSQYKGLVLLALLLAAINQIFSFLDPYIFQKIIDGYVINKDGSLKNYNSVSVFLKGAGLLILAAMGVAMVSRIAKAFQDYFINVITQRLGAQIYSDGLRHSLDMPFQVFEDQRSGETLGVLQKVRIDVEKLIAAFVNILFTSLVGIIFVMTYAISVNWLLGVVYLSSVPILGLVSSLLSKRIKVIQKTIVAQTTSLAGSTTESLRNIELIKSLGLSGQETKRLNDTTAKILKLELKKVRYIRSLSFVQGTFVNLLRNGLLLMMLYLVVIGELTVGQFFTFFLYSFFVFGPLQELGNIINIYRETEVSLENFQRILKMPKERIPENPVDVGRLQELAFEQVSFKHLTAGQNALTNISFHMNVGQTIAFVGPSGAGKTTLVKLLVGLYMPHTGQILYNKVPGSSIDLNGLREQIGFVTQDTQLFAGTIRENLKFAAPNATDEQCLEVLTRAAAHNLLARADKGLDTVLGEGGVKVSGGEKQRLSIARALLRKPTLLVFDEATSALDSLTEEEISKTVRDVSESHHHMTILIAHRLSTVLHADCIFVLEKGKIVEAGKHQELLEQKGLYYAMWRQQVGERTLSDTAASVSVLS
ncbi:ABC transporter ATP-binding protein [Rhodocytophaga aerolata]|uniref:ABC transporter ATP-binding protein n=1 Tax=Rhodocytophaga aerolata TaxID=455078 RepID=A0ABT8R4W0_9BACT|nr:ABC transporter ATP-binding protein [Rhodocytophaga aerolata]MDO1446439.1 ABC transporter ATP-binding protein [Rhodocytophaga aerolata]